MSKSIIPRPFTRRSLTHAIAFCALATCAVAVNAQAQEAGSEAVEADGADPVRTHLRHVAEAFRGTPDGMGLLPTAVTEAEIAQQHATLAAQDPTDLEGMQRHAGHVLNALDPSREENGPGRSYGVVAAADRTAHYVELAAASEGASDNVRTHATHVATAARHASENAVLAADLAEEIQDAEEAAEAAELLEQLVALTNEIVDGIDADGDGRIGWQEEEGGLAQATQHLGLLMSGEGIG